MNPKRRRRYRRNPGISGVGGGIVKQLVQGLKDGFVVSFGRGITGMVSSKIPLGTSAPAKGAVQLLIGTGLAMVVRKVTKSERTAAFFAAGAASMAITTALAPMLPASIAPLLGGFGSYVPAVRMASYPRALNAGASSLAAAPGNLGRVGDVYDQEGSDGMFS